MSDFILLEGALEDLYRIYQTRLEFGSEQGASRLIDKFYTTFSQIGRYPYMGSPREKWVPSHIRFFPVESYFIIYSLHTFQITVQAIIDGRTDIPTQLANRSL